MVIKVKFDWIRNKRKYFTGASSYFADSIDYQMVRTC